MKILTNVASLLLESFYTMVLRLVAGSMAILTAIFGTSPEEYVQALLNQFVG